MASQGMSAAQPCCAAVRRFTAVVLSQPALVGGYRPCRTAAILLLMPYLWVYGCVVLYGPLHGDVGAAGLDQRHSLRHLLDLGWGWGCTGVGLWVKVREPE